MVSLRVDLMLLKNSIIRLKSSSHSFGINSLASSQSIQLQRVVNPIFGGLDFPIGFSTSVLANYLYNGVNDVTFPNDDSKLEYGQTDYAKNLYENLNLAAIGAPSEFIKGNTMTLGSLGDVYVTLNPTAKRFHRRKG